VKLPAPVKNLRGSMTSATWRTIRGMTTPVRHNPQQSRFEVHVDGHLSVADYHLRDGVMVMHHTEVPPPARGHGIAARLVAAALAHAREHGLRVDAQCSYVREYMRKHPETQSLSV
jgi:uncharacterized protein